MKLKSQSWHFRIATVYGRGDFYRSTDLCAYLRRFTLGSFFWSCAILLGTAAGYFLLMAPIMWAVLCIADRHWYAPIDEALTGLILWGIGAAVFGLLWWAVYREDSGKSFMPVPEALIDAYRGWKQRYCPVIEFADQK